MPYTRKKIRDKSFKNSFSSVSKWFFSSASGTLAIFINKNYEGPLWISILAGSTTFVACFFVMFLYSWRKNIIREKKRLNFDNIYGDAIIELNVISSEINKVRKVNPDPEALINTLTAICGKLKLIYDKKTNSICSICIKVITDDSDIGVETELVTLARDPKAKSLKRRTMADTPTIQHNIFKNTRFVNFFKYLGEQRGRFYINNNLPEDKYYESTYFEIYGDIAEEHRDSTELREKHWTLPYMSEIVVPICPLNHDHKKGQKPVLYGFLCVDSTETEVFNDNYDVSVIEGVADGIFDLIHLYVQDTNNKK